MNSDRTAGHELLKTGTLVDFDVVNTKTELTPDKENVYVRVDLVFQADDDQESSDVVEWVAFGFLFCLAVLSFADARPRGTSDIDYSTKDELTLADFMEGLSFGAGGLHFGADYIRGRLLKTDITVRSDGTVTLTTWVAVYPSSSVTVTVKLSVPL